MTTPAQPRLLSDQALAWCWARYRRCTFPVASYPKRMARHEFTALTEAKGKPIAESLVFQYRRQIFGRRAAKWTKAEFARKAIESSRDSRLTLPPTPVPSPITAPKALEHQGQFDLLP